MTFNFKKTFLDEVILVESDIYSDNRGFFTEAYKESVFKANGITCDFIQENISVSTAKVLRGLHFQKGESAQAKLVRCVSGCIYDVAVDIRPESPNYKKYVRVELSSNNNNALFIPRGFAHGFVVVSNSATVSYKVDNEFNAAADAGVYWADEDLDIDWGINFAPILSQKDSNLPRLKEINV